MNNNQLTHLLDKKWHIHMIWQNKMLVDIYRDKNLLVMIIVHAMKEEKIVKNMKLILKEID